MTEIDLALAQDWLDQYVDTSLQASSIRRLRGGMIHEVWLIETEGPPGAVVAKTNRFDQADGFRHEQAVMNWYRQHTGLPVPEPIATFADEERDLAGLLMEYVSGRTLDQARLSPLGVERLQGELAQHIGALHQHTAKNYGAQVSDHGYERWLDLFRPLILAEYQAVRDQIASRSREVIEDMLADLHHWLPEAGRPTVVHGDLWATNVMVDDNHADRPRISAFIDGTATACDPEYELSYLRLFKTADDTFFKEYERFHPIREGFDRRCRVYWLNTMMLHVRLFGDQYLPACEDLASQIARLAK